MGKKGRILLLLLAVMLSFSAGVFAREEGKSRAVVERIYVQGKCMKGWVLRNYTDEEKIRAVLNRLRIFRREGAAKEDPLTIPGSDYTIRIRYSDGTMRTYRLKAGQYLCLDQGIWYRVDEDRAQELEDLLWEVKTDRGVDLPAPP